MESMHIRALVMIPALYLSTAKNTARGADAGTRRRHSENGRVNQSDRPVLKNLKRFEGRGIRTAVNWQHVSYVRISKYEVKALSSFGGCKVLHSGENSDR